LKKQAAAYAAVTDRRVIPAYELVAIIGQPQPGRDGKYRRRESYAVIDRMLRAARAAGFKLILDVQTGHSTVLAELSYLAPYLQQPDVYVALDPEFSMGDGGVPGQRIGTMRADEVNDAIDILEYVQERYRLPRKVLMVHQFTMAMLPDKERIWTSDALDVVLVADGFGGQALKRHTYSMVLHQGAFAFSGLAFLPAYLVRDFGLGLSMAAAIVALYGIGGFFYAFAARRLLGALGESGIALSGGIAMGAAWLLLAAGGSWLLALPACLIGGLGFYMLHGTLQTHATQMVPGLRGTQG